MTCFSVMVYIKYTEAFFSNNINDNMMFLDMLEEEYGFQQKNSTIMKNNNHTTIMINNASNATPIWYKEPCTFLPQDTSPLPTILISLGRSGSSVTWQTIAAILQNRNVAQEFTGSTFRKSSKFFHSIESNPDIHFDWALKRLCYIQQHQPDVNSTNPGIAGFQWKPHIYAWNCKYAREARRMMAHSEPRIKFIYLVRNPLDVKLSNMKHSLSKKNGTNIGAHCSVGDEKCVQKMVKYESGISFPVGKALLAWLNNEKQRRINIENSLKRDNITFVRVDYDHLYSSVGYDEAPAEEWMKIFRYLGRGPTQGLTMKTVRSYFPMAPTHSKSKNETIRNFQEVVSTLKGTEFEHLLRE
jgi:hypothetical protein